MRFAALKWKSFEESNSKFSVENAISLSEVRTMPVQNEQIDDLIARITTSLEEIAGTRQGEKLFANVNECLHEFVEEAGLAGPSPSRERGRERGRRHHRHHEGAGREVERRVVRL